MAGATARGILVKCTKGSRKNDVADDMAMMKVRVVAMGCSRLSLKMHTRLPGHDAHEECSDHGGDAGGRNQVGLEGGDAGGPLGVGERVLNMRIRRGLVRGS